MGTWIGHLRIAENLLAALPGLDEAAFAFGNLAPDSGVPNADWSQFDPPKEVTHFLQPGEDEGRIRDLDFCRVYLADLDASGDAVPYSFVLGYFFHLVSDNLWAKRVVATAKAEFAELVAQRGRDDAIWNMKKDWYGLDHRYVRDHPNSLFWRVFMPAPNPPALLPFLPKAALHRQFDYIRKYYSQPDPSRVLDRPYPFLNEATMSRYVADSTAALLKIHARLQERPALDNALTALTFLDGREIAPYHPPLGDA